MASPLSELLGIFGQSTGQTMGGDLALTRESPSTYAQLFTGAPKEESFWAKPGGKALGSILSVLGTGGIGALLGLLGSPEARGLGAARGAAMGAGAGAMMDIGQRRAASQSQAVEGKIMSDIMQAQKKQPDLIQQYEYYVKQALESNQQPISFNDWKARQSAISAGGTSLEDLRKTLNMFGINVGGGSQPTTRPNGPTTPTSKPSSGPSFEWTSGVVKGNG
ncbi:MAG: hypothetical protein KBA02_00300 [Paludibacteraceae bacterium]|nr:hypothetical protein [Paludibacteraceae bacterium]